MRFFASLLLASLVVTSSLPAQEQQPSASPKPEAKKDDKAKKKDGDDSGTSKDFDIPMPINVPVKGIQIPHYGENGQLIMLMNADVARKIDDNHIEMENLKIDAYSDDGKKFYIELPKSVFNLENRVLTGNDRVLIRREDFEIRGDQGEFETKTRFAKVIGNVQMIINSAENLQ
ncbi:hypothetical protein TSACC_22114 [Terrimicrobium sacchariphilum]|uniref:Lipopolysaccharide export system protein LptA n=1 Tax=Terrimicrobium sacchariphilum TaxID=690879 RepID=A0A146GA67_TERSA|nr:hypothetical protein [Terrimicrobium sacchariphilum]GAT33697.1 hypothetical protein TSACC_22114 [Terrimicrobium sacchariphilum]